MSSIFEVAGYILSKSSVTHMKLQRLCYYSQAWYLANYGKSMFSNRFEAWVNGPVSPDLYPLYKSWGMLHIPKRVYFSELPCDAQGIIDKVLEVYEGYTDVELNNISRWEYPWLKAREGHSLSDYSRNPISMRDMGKFYGRRIGKQYDNYVCCK